MDEQVQQPGAHVADLGQRLGHLAGDEVEAARARPEADLALEPHAGGTRRGAGSQHGQRRGRTALDVPSTRPRASSARTATWLARARAATTVSNPSRAFEDTPRRRDALPASTCQRATSVAPFQLA